MNAKELATAIDNFSVCVGQNRVLTVEERKLIVAALSNERSDVERQSAWISVKDRMPPPYHAVLIGWDRIAVRIKPIAAFWTGEKWTRDVLTDDNFFVSHWMELPDQPTLDNSEWST